jgi:hypothetical protein
LDLTRQSYPASETEALKIANVLDYGFSAAVFGELEHASRVAAQINAGLVHVNYQTAMEDTRPFGGTQQSGNPIRLGGEWDLEGYTTFRWVTETRKAQPYTLPNMYSPRTSHREFPEGISEGLNMHVKRSVGSARASIRPSAFIAAHLTNPNHPTGRSYPP